MRVVSAIVPAAGLSSRFGGPNKLLEPWHGSTVVGSVARTLMGSCQEVIVVTGRDPEQVAKAVAPARCVFNSQFEEGLGTSIAAGVASCGETDGFLIALGDMPDISKNAVETLLSAFEDCPLDAILAPVYSAEPNRPGHPVLFGSAYRKDLEELKGDEGARSVMLANQSKLRRIPVSGKLNDIDFRDDLKMPQ